MMKKIFFKNKVSNDLIQHIFHISIMFYYNFEIFIFDISYYNFFLKKKKQNKVGLLLF